MLPRGGERGGGEGGGEEGWERRKETEKSGGSAWMEGGMSASSTRTAQRGCLMSDTNGRG